MTFIYFVGRSRKVHQIVILQAIFVWSDINLNNYQFKETSNIQIVDYWFCGKISLVFSEWMVKHVSMNFSLNFELTIVKLITNMAN